ncbi:MAG: type II secretion system protein [Oceanicoccus sp.]
MLLPTSKEQGFTLVELVAVIVLLGIVAVATTQFIGQGMNIFVDTSRRDSLQQEGRFVVERISRELRNALPGSVRTSGDCLEFIPIVAASSYIDAISVASITSLRAASFSFPNCDSSSNCDFSGLGYQVAVYTVDNSDVYPLLPPQIANLDNIGAVAGGVRIVELDAVSPGHIFARESPQKRFYIINDRVSFCAVDGGLTRHSSYTAAGNLQPTPPVGGIASLLSESIRVTDSSISPATTITVFDYTAGTLQRAGLVHMNMHFFNAKAPDEWVRFSQEVLVRNTP